MLRSGVIAFAGFLFAIGLVIAGSLVSAGEPTREVAETADSASNVTGCCRLSITGPLELTSAERWNSPSTARH
ncbi:hypothetical protein [Streptomyces sp. NPDC006997]|uniref:hypothetical protein n=1 Tax=Streptomyces sp. NPDC006997 TaxID=3155356 RepID=UPI00340611CD